MFKLTFAAGLLSAGIVMAQNPILTVYAPDYFTSEWGPGPSIEAKFEETCNCDLVFSAGELLPRLVLEGQNTKADVVIGLNTDITKKARELGIFSPHNQDNSRLNLPVEWEDEIFLPFDWSYVSFVFDTTKTNLPNNFEELASLPEDIKIVIQDPRSSISGLALVLWIKQIYGDNAAAYWQKLAPKILTVTKGWSEAYGLFTDGEAARVLSFTTSPAYHIAVEEDNTKQAAIFKEGHYPFFELAAKVKSSENDVLSSMFMKFILSDEFQDLIPMTNWSYPSAQAVEKWPSVFSDLPMPQSAVYLSENAASEITKQAIEEWRSALSQ